MIRTSSIALLWIICICGCKTPVQEHKPFAGPVFSSQYSPEFHSWSYDSTTHAFEFYQSGWEPSFLYQPVEEGFTLATMIRLPVHGGGLRFENSEQSISILLQDQFIDFFLPDHSDRIALDSNNFPLELFMISHNDSLKISMRLKNRNREEITGFPVSMDSARAGLFVEGYGGFHFENVRLDGASSLAKVEQMKYLLEMLDLTSGSRRILFRSSSRIAAISWSPEGHSIGFQRDGRLEELDLTTGLVRSVQVDQVDAVEGGSLRPEHREWAITAQSRGYTQVYFLSEQGGKPQIKTVYAPSEFSDWDATGEWLVYSAMRRDDQRDIYRLTYRWGREERLTFHDSLDGGAAFGSNPDKVFFHSNRNGPFQIWQWQGPDEELELISRDRYNDWFPQPSPDGRYLLVYSSPGRQAGQEEEILLRLYDLQESNRHPVVLATYPGEVGSPVLNAWSPSGNEVVFVSTSAGI